MVLLLDVLGGEEERVGVRGERKESCLLSIYVLGIKTLHAFKPYNNCKIGVIFSHFAEEKAGSLGG